MPNDNFTESHSHRTQVKIKVSGHPPKQILKDISLKSAKTALPLSDFGAKIAGGGLAQRPGILELMADLGRALSHTEKNLMLGGGNPAAVPGMQRVWRERMQALLNEQARFDAMLANYDTPQGRPEFLEAVAFYFKNTYGWPITTENVAVTSGSQTAFFSLFNMLAGRRGRLIKRVLLPFSPEYIGYADQGIYHDMFRSTTPWIEELDPHTFKYHVDFKHLEINKDVALVALSRPTNPTGNVLSDSEIEEISCLAKKHGVYLLLDGAYGTPFPNIIFTPANPFWDEHIIASFSLSKLGLPGTRTGIVIANKEIISALCAANAIIGLANCNVGQALTAPLVKSGQLVELCREHITPFYAERARLAAAWIKEFFPESMPYYVHKAEGALFMWFWFRELPITSQELYTRLAARGVIVVSGHHFFYGISDQNWRHRWECIRVNYSQPQETVREGLRIIADEAAKAYQG